MSRTFVFLPPLASPTGGMTVLAQIAARLAEAGRHVALLTRPKGWRPDGITGVDMLDWEQADPGPADVWLVPEGWPNALAPGLSAGARCVVYCQNWAYLFSALPEGVGWDQLPVRHLAVSQPVALFLAETLGEAPPVVRPALDSAVHRPSAPLGEKPDGPLRVAWMPRKNKALARQVRDIVQARLRRRDVSGGRGLDWVALEGLDRADVAREMNRSHVFLATGFPEGFALPPLEAMACGCLSVGFAGRGGFDYMRNALEFPGAYRPWWPLRETDFGGNGLWCADGDALAAALAVERAVALWVGRDEALRRILENGQATARAYDAASQSREVLAAWDAWFSDAS